MLGLVSYGSESDEGEAPAPASEGGQAVMVTPKATTKVAPKEKKKKKKKKGKISILRSLVVGSEFQMEMSQEEIDAAEQLAAAREADRKEKLEEEQRKREAEAVDTGFDYGDDDEWGNTEVDYGWANDGTGEGGGTEPAQSTVEVKTTLTSLVPRAVAKRMPKPEVPKVEIVDEAAEEATEAEPQEAGTGEVGPVGMETDQGKHGVEGEGEEEEEDDAEEAAIAAALMPSAALSIMKPTGAAAVRKSLDPMNFDTTPGAVRKRARARKAIPEEDLQPGQVVDDKDPQYDEEDMIPQPEGGELPAEEVRRLAIQSKQNNNKGMIKVQEFDQSAQLAELAKLTRNFEDRSLRAIEKHKKSQELGDVSDVAKQRHQLSYVAHQAALSEATFLAGLGTHNSHKATTRQKYGW